MRTSAASALRRLTPLLLLFFTSLDAFAIGAVIGGVVGGCLLMALAAGAYVWIKRCKQRPPSQPTSSAKATGEVTLTEATTEKN